MIENVDLPQFQLDKSGLNSPTPTCTGSAADVHEALRAPLVIAAVGEQPPPRSLRRRQSPLCCIWLSVWVSVSLSCVVRCVAASLLIGTGGSCRGE